MDFPIAFETKDLIGFAVLIPAFLAASAALYFSGKLREIALFLIVLGPILPLGFDIHFFGAEWYRGTTRGFEISFVDILAGALLLCVLLDPRERNIYWPAGLAPLLLFILWTAVTVVIMQPRIFGSYELLKMFRGLIVLLVAAYYIRNDRRILIAIAGLAAAVFVQFFWSVHQWQADIYRVTGTLGHPNSLSMYLCLVTPVLAAAAVSKRPPLLMRLFFWMAVAASAPVILLTISRAGIPVYALVVGSAIVACVSWRPTPAKIGFAALGLVVMSGLIASSWDKITTRYEQTSLTEEYLDDSTEGRGYYFRQAETIMEDRPFGVGLNNWSYIVSKEFSTERGLRYDDYDSLSSISDKEIELDPGAYSPPAHNLGLLTLGETGWVGLFLLSVLWLRWFQIALFNQFGARQKEIRFVSMGILLGFFGLFLQSMTEWTFRQSDIFMTFHVLLGILCALHMRRKNPPVLEVEDDSERRTSSI